MSTAIDHYRREWDAARAALPGAGIGWIDRTRREALDRFCERGFPTPRDEDWKYTSLRPLERRAFRLDPGPTERRVTGKGRRRTRREFLRRGGSPDSNRPPSSPS